MSVKEFEVDAPTMAEATIELSAFTKLDMSVNEYNPALKRYKKFDAKLDFE